MLDSENHNYWNVLGVISMSKGNLNLVTLILHDVVNNALIWISVCCEKS